MEDRRWKMEATTLDPTPYTLYPVRGMEEGRWKQLRRDFTGGGIEVLDFLEAIRRCAKNLYRGGSSPPHAFRSLVFFFHLPSEPSVA
jgi:hypothetical protein